MSYTNFLTIKNVYSEIIRIILLTATFIGSRIYHRVKSFKEKIDFQILRILFSLITLVKNKVGIYWMLK